jgi:hypothetical protein
MRREIIIDETKRSYELTLDGIEIGPDAVLDAGRTANALMQIELASALLQAAEMCGGHTERDRLHDRISQDPQAVRQGDRRIPGAQASDHQRLCRL